MIFRSDQFNLNVVLIFSLIFFVAQVFVSTLIAYFLGWPSLENDGLIYWLFVQHGPYSLVSITVFFFLAKRSLSGPYVHAFAVLVIAELLAIFAVSMIMEKPYLSPTWFLDIPVSVFTLLVGMELGTDAHVDKETAL